MTRRNMSVLLVLAAFLAGCNIVGPVVAIVHGPPKVAPAYRLDRKRTTVVFIDDRGNLMPRRALVVHAAKAAQDALLERRVLEDMISADSALAVVAAADASGKLIDIPEIGRRLGADVVIYAVVDRFSLTPDGVVYQPTAVVRVKVIDVAEEKRLWPEEKREGQTLTLVVPPRTEPLPSTTSGVQHAELDAADLLGRAIAQLFYEHEARASLIK
jgi:hypothetical protein